MPTINLCDDASNVNMNPQHHAMQPFGQPRPCSDNANLEQNKNDMNRKFDPTDDGKTMFAGSFTIVFQIQLWQRFLVLTFFAIASEFPLVRHQWRL